MFRPVALLTAWVLTCLLTAPSAFADPESAPAVADAPAPDAAPPAADGRVESSPAATTKTPDGVTLTVSAKDETQLAIAPLTTALSSREYEVGGVFDGAITGPQGDEPPHGTLEVGYQIGCGIDQSTTNGVTLNGSIGVTPGLGVTSVGPVPTFLAPISGGISVSLKPGLINVVPVSKKNFEGADPFVMISGFRVKIDGCVGESFIRSFAFLTRSTKRSDAVLAYYGVTKKV